MIKNNGNTDLAKESLYKFQKTRFKIFLKNIYGDIEGEYRYNQWNISKLYNNKNKYSKSSQKFIYDIIEHCSLDKK